jgi:hypothetical protein
MSVPDISTQRADFADFLRRVAAGGVGAIEWQRFIVTHYHDQLLENVRLQVAKLSMDRDGGKEWSNSELASLQHWSRQLRGTA